MLRRTLAFLLTVVAATAAASACSPTLPPTTVPTPPDPAFEPLKTTLQAYIDQINQAVSQMDQVTQQNAALVEEAAAAAESLQDQAVIRDASAIPEVDEVREVPGLPTRGVVDGKNVNDVGPVIAS